MKSSIKKLFVMLAIAMSFVVVQSACADEVTGIIQEVLEKNVIVVLSTEGESEGDYITISGVRSKYLCTQYNLCLAGGEEVTVGYVVVSCRKGVDVNQAYSITVGDLTVKLR